MSVTVTPNSALVTDACAAALLRRAFFSAAQRGRKATTMASRATKLIAGGSLVLALGVGLYFYVWHDYGLARGFCGEVPIGMAAAEAVSLAKSESRKVNLHLAENELRVIFGTFHSCSCRVVLRSAKVEDKRAWCTD